MFCRSCGKQIEDGSTFCKLCGAAQNDAAPAAPAGGSFLNSLSGGMKSGEPSGIPTGGITGTVLGFMGKDQKKSVKTFWRVASVVGAILLMILAVSLFTGSAVTEDSLLKMSFSFAGFWKVAMLGKGGITVLTLIVLIAADAAAVGFGSRCVRTFMSGDALGTLQKLARAFIAVTAGKVMLVIWALGLDGGIAGMLIFSLILTAALAFLFIVLAKEFKNYKENVVPPSNPQNPVQ